MVSILQQCGVMPSSWQKGGKTHLREGLQIIKSLEGKNKDDQGWGRFSGQKILVSPLVKMQVVYWKEDKMFGKKCWSKHVCCLLHLSDVFLAAVCV